MTFKICLSHPYLLIYNVYVYEFVYRKKGIRIGWFLFFCMQNDSFFLQVFIGNYLLEQVVGKPTLFILIKRELTVLLHVRGEMTDFGLPLMSSFGIAVYRLVDGIKWIRCSLIFANFKICILMNHTQAIGKGILF